MYYILNSPSSNIFMCYKCSTLLYKVFYLLNMLNLEMKKKVVLEPKNT